MNQLTIRIKQLGQSLNKWQNKTTPKIEYWVDKYKVVKYGCVLGIALNGYFIYDGIITAIVLTRVQNQVANKREVFYKRVQDKRELQLQGSKPLQSQPPK